MRKRPQLAFPGSLLLALVVLFGPASPCAEKPAASPNAVGEPMSGDMGKELKRVSDVYALVQQYAADPVSPDQAFYEGAIPGLLHKLDPHSVFFDPGQFQQLQQMERSTSKGFGTIVSVLPGRVFVLQALAGTPSARSGISAGDEILAVNNIRLDRLEMEQIVQLLGEARQKQAHLYVRRPGAGKLLEFTLNPAEMQSKSVDRAFSIEPGIGYVRITSFEPNTAVLLREAIERLGGSDLRGVVLDLRKNPGGVVAAAIQTCALFLNPGQKILTVRGRKVPEQTESVPYGGNPYRFKMAVLVNEKTASASEIVAGALQDHDRAIIVGEPTFGKGLVQSVFPLSEKTGLALTTALYYTPSGRSIQRPFTDEQFALASTAAHPNREAEFKTDNGRIVVGGGGIVPDVLVQPAGQSRLEIALEASGVLLSFATEYTREHKIDESFEVTPAVLDQFQAYAAQHRIAPSVAEWASVRDFITDHLKVEIFNQSLGVEKGDEVEARFDLQVRRAVEAVH